MESAADPQAPGAERRVFWTAAAVTIVLDLVTKLVAEATLLRTPGISVLGDWFQLRLVYNQGAAFGLHGPVAATALLVHAMPTASPSYILARQLGGDAPLMAGIVAVQTVLAAVAIPLALAALFTPEG